MRIPYSLSVFLSVFVVSGSCQRDASRMCMNGNGAHTPECTKEENGMALTPSEAIVSGHPGMITQNGSGHVLPATSSNDVLVSTGEQLVTTPSQHHETSRTEPPAAEVVQSTGTDEKKEEALQGSLELQMWFQRFVDALDHAEEWDEVAGVLSEGKRCGYLDKAVAWDDDQYTPLHYVAEAGDLEVVKELVEKYQIPVDIRTGGCQRTPLHLASLRGYLEVAKYLVDKGAKWSDTDNAKSNALHYAALGIKGQKNTDVIKFFRNQGADLEVLADGKFNLLHLAIRTSNASLAKYLMEQCPDLAHKTSGGILSPLELAKAKEERIAKIIQERLKGIEQDPCAQLSKRCNIS